MLLFILAEWIATFWDGWCYCHCGRWNSHIGWNVVKADLITLVADGKATGSIYFNLSSVLFIRTSSHIWGRWYLPIFLFRDGLLTLMNIDSLNSLERFCSSLPTMLKFSSVAVWPMMLLWLWIGEGAFRCSLNLSPNVLAVSPMYPHHIPTCHIWICRLCHSFLLCGLCLQVPPIHLLRSFHF